jgi:DDE superfamily endonuclease
MPLSHLPTFLTTAFAGLAHWLDKRSAARLPLLLAGILFARDRRTVTSWFRAAAITVEFRCAYSTVHAVGRSHQDMAFTVLQAVRPLLEPACLRVAIDDTPTARYGPCVEGAGIHHNPSPGPAAQRHVYGHVWVTLAGLARHPDWDAIALPLLGSLYIRQIDVDKLPPERSRPFRTKLELAVEQLAWLQGWIGHRYPKRRVVTDGGYAKRPFLKGARKHGFTVISRLRKDAALLSLPEPKPASQRGPQATYGKKRISLAKRAAAAGGWEQVECSQYGEKVSKTIKTFTATWRPAGGVIRVVLVKEEDDWLPYFAVGVEVTAIEILEAMADRSALEQTNKDVKEIWGAGEQQVRNVFCNEGCFNLNLWMYSLVEAWAWDKEEEELVDRSTSPWDSEPRRPSHADKRKALQRQALQRQIDEALSGRPNKGEIRALAQRLLQMAA